MKCTTTRFMQDKFLRPIFFFFLALISIFCTPLFDPIPTHLKKQTRAPIQASLKNESSFPRHSHQNCLWSAKMSIFLCSNKLSRSLDLKKKKKKCHQGERTHQTGSLQKKKKKKKTSLLPETSVKFGCVTRYVQFSVWQVLKILKFHQWQFSLIFFSNTNLGFVPEKKKVNVLVLQKGSGQVLPSGRRFPWCARRGEAFRAVWSTRLPVHNHARGSVICEAFQSADQTLRSLLLSANRHTILQWRCLVAPYSNNARYGCCK